MAKKKKEECDLASEYCGGVEGAGYRCEDCVEEVVEREIAAFRAKVFEILGKAYLVTPLSIIEDRIRGIER